MGTSISKQGAWERQSRSTPNASPWRRTMRCTGAIARRLMRRCSVGTRPSQMGTPRPICDPIGRRRTRCVIAACSLPLLPTPPTRVRCPLDYASSTRAPGHPPLACRNPDALIAHPIALAAPVVQRIGFALNGMGKCSEARSRLDPRPAHSRRAPILVMPRRLIYLGMHDLRAVDRSDRGCGRRRAVLV